MKTLIAILTIIAFLQAAIVPLDLVLIILICRSYIKEDQANLYLAFALGLLTSYLTLMPLGLNSLIYLILVQTTQVLSKSRLAGNLLLVVPLNFALLSLNEAASSFTAQKNLFSLAKIILESMLSLPIVYLVRLWEERFIVKKEIKLKI